MKKVGAIEKRPKISKPWLPPSGNQKKPHEKQENNKKNLIIELLQIILD